MPCASLYQACHLDGLDHSCMPDANAANTLATKIEQLRKKNITQPFVYVQLEDFLPEWCHGAQLDSDGEVEGSAVKKARAKKRLTALQWTAAFDRHIHGLSKLHNVLHFLCLSSQVCYSIRSGRTMVICRRYGPQKCRLAGKPTWV